MSKKNKIIVNFCRNTGKKTELIKAIQELQKKLDEAPIPEHDRHFWLFGKHYYIK